MHSLCIALFLFLFLLDDKKKLLTSQKTQMRTRQIKTDIIEDEWYVSLQSDEKLFFLHLLISPRNELSGLFYYPDRNILIDNPDLTKERLIIIKKKFEKENKVFFKDGWVFLVNFIKNNHFNNKKHKKGVAKQLSDLQTRSWDVYEYFVKKGLMIPMIEYFGIEAIDRITKGDQDVC
jgi:hypothetical protein